MRVFIFLGRRPQAFIRFSRGLVDPKRVSTTGMVGAAQNRFFRELAGSLSSSVTSRFGLHDFCHLWSSSCPSLITLSKPLGTRTYFQGLKVARPSLSPTTAQEICQRAMRMFACLVTGFTANKTVRRTRGLCGLSDYNLFSSVTLTGAKCQEKFESECCCLWNKLRKIYRLSATKS